MSIFSTPPLRSIPLGPLDLQVWGLFVALGILVATALAARRARRRGIPGALVWDLAFWVVVAGLVGARLLYVLEYWQSYTAEPWRVFAIWEGGMSAFGAILLGIPAGWWFARRHGLPVGMLAEVVAPPALLGDALGRLGGAASHMYPGTPTTFPISYVLNGVQRHEVGIELALASLVGVVLIRWLERLGQHSQIPNSKFQIPNKPKVPNSKRFGAWSLVLGASEYQPALVLGWYSVERFLLDFLRASDLPESDLRYGGLTLAQWLAVTGLILTIRSLLQRVKSHSLHLGSPG